MKKKLSDTLKVFDSFPFYAFFLAVGPIGNNA